MMGNDCVNRSIIVLTVSLLHIIDLVLYIGNNYVIITVMIDT